MKITKQFLYREYVVLQKTSEKIGRECGTSGRNVRYYLIKFGFQKEMQERRRTAGIGKIPVNKGVYQTKFPKLGRRYVNRNGKVLTQARFLMQEKMGRILLRKEIVHHKDGNPLNDAADNLELLDSQANHIKIHKPHNFRHVKVTPRHEPL